MERLALQLRPDPSVKKSFGSTKDHEIVVVNQDDGTEKDLGIKNLSENNLSQ